MFENFFRSKFVHSLGLLGLLGLLCRFVREVETGKAGKRRNIVKAAWCASGGSRVRLMKHTICFQFTFDCTNITWNLKVQKDREWTSEGKLIEKLCQCVESWGGRSVKSVSIGSSALPPYSSLRIPFKLPSSKDPTADYKRMISSGNETVLKVAFSWAD